MNETDRPHIRPIAQVITAHRQLEGGGFPVRRPFPTHGLDQVDPFLLLDEMGPVDWGPGQAIGAPDHPHRGFETVTYLLDGRFEHRDSKGNHGVLEPGDVQWMTAGAGVVHSEMPEADFRDRGGRMHGFQLWVNLPRRDKMMPPRYQGIPSDHIPEATTDDGRVRVRVIAGRALDQTAVIDTRTPIAFQHWIVEPGGGAVTAVPNDHQGFAFVFRGKGAFGPKDELRPVAEGEMALFGRDGDAVAFQAPDDAEGPMHFLLVTGVPLREPVARYGPFVMSTKQEILDAVRDFQAGRLDRG
jgi:hypothetical protein